MNTSENNSGNEMTKIEFPCLYPIKVIVKNEVGIKDDILKVFQISNINIITFSEKESKNSNYMSFSFDIMANSEKQLQELFFDLKKNPNIKMVL